MYYVMGLPQKLAKKPLVWMHRAEFYAEKIMALHQGNPGRMSVVSILRRIRINPSWGGEPIPLRIKLTDDPTLPLAKISLDRGGTAFTCEARKISPKETEFQLLCLMGYGILGHVRPGQEIILNRADGTAEAEDARLFAAHLCARLYGGHAKNYLITPKLRLVESYTSK